MKLRYNQISFEEYTEAVEYYLTNSSKAAREFIDEVERVEEILQQFPHIGYEEFPELRKFPLQGFPYTFIYSPQEEFIEVIAVMHQSREPNYWIDRK
ncbi:MAG: type II toxin-antitoxin system RelE/ParE family toxin [bacterium]